MLALHRADQAEARAMEGKQPRDEPLPDDLTPRAGNHADAGSPVKCSKCAATFKWWSGLERHLVKIHKMDAATVEKTVKALQQEAYEIEGRKANMQSKSSFTSSSPTRVQ
jgi:hypothetical protein